MISTRMGMGLTAVLATVLVPAATAVAQDANTANRFDELESRAILEEGDRVWVIFDFTGAGDEREIKGTIVTISDAAVTLYSDNIPAGRTDLTVDRVSGEGSIEIPADRVRSVKVYRKARRWGTLIGGAAGMTVGFALAAQWSENEGGCGRCYAVFGTVFGLIGMGGGWAVDLVRDGRPIVYSSTADLVMAPRYTTLTFTPIVSRQTQGLAFSITW